MTSCRLAVVTSHPIQYQTPWFRALAQEVDLEVLFCHRQDARGHAAAGFDVEFEWDVPLLDGYHYRWLENRARRPDVSRFFGCDTPEIEAILTAGRFDACIVSGWYLKSYVQAIRGCWHAGVPILSRGDSQLATPRSGLKRLAKGIPYRWFLGRIDAHLYVGRANMEYLEHYGVSRSRLFFAPHFVDNEFFATGAAMARETGAALELRRGLGLSPATTVFAFVGKLIDKKRPQDFVEAIALARERGADVAGLVIGSGAWLSKLRSMVEQRAAPVVFAGFRNQSELPGCLAAADALVLPSDARETWGLVVNEAMACGLPAIVSRAAGCAGDLIEQDRTGYTYEPGDAGALAHAMTVLRERLTVDRDAIQADVLAKIEQYSCAAAVRGTLDAVRAVVEARRRRERRLVSA